MCIWGQHNPCGILYRKGILFIYFIYELSILQRVIISLFAGRLLLVQVPSSGAMHGCYISASGSQTGGQGHLGVWGVMLRCLQILGFQYLSSYALICTRPSMQKERQF